MWTDLYYQFRNPDDVDSDNEYEDDGVTHADQKSTVSGGVSIH